MRITAKDVFKFLSGVFFATTTSSAYFAWYQVSVPFLGLTVTPDLWVVRGFIHFVLFLIAVYCGFVRK